MPAVAYAPTISPAFSFVFRLLIWNETMDAASPSLVICIDNWRGLPIGNSLPLVGTGPNRDIVVGQLSLDKSENVCLFMLCGVSSCSFHMLFRGFTVIFHKRRCLPKSL